MISIIRDKKIEQEIFPDIKQKKCIEEFKKSGKFHWCKKAEEIRDLLNIYTDYHCTYCGKNIEKGEIDHLYPKNKYKDLAYNISNLFISCHDCNNTRPKSNKDFFEILDNKKFFRPDDKNYDFYKYYLPDFLNGKILVKENINPTDKEKAKHTIEIVFKLNRKSLVKARKRAFKEKNYNFYKYFFSKLNQNE